MTTFGHSVSTSGVDREMEVTFLADQISQPYHFSAVINPMMIEVLENFAPFKLRFYR